MDMIKQKLTIAVLSSLLLFAPGLYADAYLDALETEAGSTVKAKAKPQANEDQSALETELQNKLPSTYKIYVKLNDANKLEVVEVRKNNENLSAVSKKVFDLYLAQSK